MPFTPGVDKGSVEGIVSVLGAPAARNVIAVSYKPFAVAGSDDGGGNEIIAHQVISAGRSAGDGTYSLDLGQFLDEVIVLALDDYGERWQPNHAYVIGDLVRPLPGNETGYVYRCTVPGFSFPTEPAWWPNSGGGTTGAVGTCTFEALESWWPLAHAPIAPQVVPYDGIILDAYFNDIVLLTHCERNSNDTVVDPLWDSVAVLILGDPIGASGPNDINDIGPFEHPLDINASVTALLKPFGNGSIRFNGAGDYIRSQAQSLEWGAHHTDLTFSMNIRPETKAGVRCIATNRDEFSVANRFLIQITAGNFPQVTWWNTAAANAGYATSSIPLTDDAWQHLEIDISGQNVKIFVEGNLGANATLSNKPSAQADLLSIGGREGDPTLDFKGNIANFEITKGVRHTSAFTPPTAVPGQKSSSHFDDFNNVVLTNVDMEFKRFAKLSLTGNAKFGGASLELLDSYADIVSTPEDGWLYFSAGDLTWEFHHKPQSLSVGDVLLDTGFDGVLNGIKFTVATGGTLEITVGGIGRLATTALTAGSYAHLEICRKDNLTRFFLNGVQQGTSIADLAILNLTRIRLGADANGEHRAPGWYDDIRITKAGRHSAGFTAPAAAHPDTKYDISPGDSAVYEWLPATDLINGDFEQAISVGWTLQFGTLPLATNMKHKGVYGFGYTSSIRTGRRHQTIAVPANTVMAELSGWLVKNNADEDQAGSFIRFYTAGMVEIKGHGTLIRTKGTTTYGPTLFKAVCEVPTNAAFARIYIAIQLVGVGTILNAGGDDIAVRWLTEVDQFSPPMTEVPFINHNLWMGSMAGWSPAIISGSVAPVITSSNGDETGYSVYGSSSAESTKITQTATIPDGEFTHALIAISGLNSGIADNNNGDSDYLYLILNFKNSQDVTVQASQVYGSCFSGNTNGTSVRATAIVELPPTAVTVEADVRFVRTSGTILNAFFSGISVKVFKMETPLSVALGLE